MKAADYLPMIVALKARIGPLQAELAALERQHRDAQSRELIAEHGITRNMVQTSGGDGMPWFGHIRAFLQWIAEQPERRPWTEWNGCLYSTAELLDGRMTRDPLMLAEHVPA